MSAFAEFEYAKAALQMGCDDYILKPPMREELRKVPEKIFHEVMGMTPSGYRDSIEDK